MSFGKMNTFIDILSTKPVKDSEGFVNTGDTVLVSVRAYKEDRHGNEIWANRSAFSTASSLFRFRKIPSLAVTTAHKILCGGVRYNVVSVEDVKGKGMYIEALAEKTEASDGGD